MLDFVLILDFGYRDPASVPIDSDHYIEINITDMVFISMSLFFKKHSLDGVKGFIFFESFIISFNLLKKNTLKYCPLLLRNYSI